MDKKTQLGPESISTRTVLVVVFVAGLVILSLSVGYFLGLAWLLTLLAPLTFQQAAAVAVLVVVSGFVVLARLPRFGLVLILQAAAVFAIVALLEVLLARLVAFLTPLSVWEASLLLSTTATLLMFVVVQSVLDSMGDEEPDSDDDWDDTPVVRRLSPDMYVLKPHVTETPAPRRPRAPRRRSKKKTDESDTN